MNDAEIWLMAERRSQYADTKQLTLRGQGIIEFARDVLARRDKELESSVAQIEAALERVREES